jgi:hypothetical protein
MAEHMTLRAFRGRLKGYGSDQRPIKLSLQERLYPLFLRILPSLWVKLSVEVEVSVKHRENAPARGVAAQMHANATGIAQHEHPRNYNPRYLRFSIFLIPR